MVSRHPLRKLPLINSRECYVVNVASWIFAMILQQSCTEGKIDIVVLSNEYHFCFRRDNGYVRVHKKLGHGQQAHDATIFEKHNYPTMRNNGLGVSLVITAVHLLDTLTILCYVDDVLRTASPLCAMCSTWTNCYRLVHETSCYPLRILPIVAYKVRHVWIIIVNAAVIKTAGTIRYRRVYTLENIRAVISSIFQQC